MTTLVKDIRTFALATLLGAAVTGAAGQDAAAAEPGDPVAGRAFAEKICAECHTVSDDDGRPSPNRYAPRFADVAKQPSTTALSLRVFLRSTHDRMPDLTLSDAEQDDLIAYILSLKPSAARPYSRTDDAT